MDVLVDDPLQLVQRLLRARLIVERHDLELAPAEHAATLVDRLDCEAELCEALLADVRKGAGKRIDVGNFDGRLLRLRGGETEHCCRGEDAHCPLENWTHG